jgi:flagellar hook-associated protein 2
LLQTTTTPISLTLAPNTSAATTAINSFVSAYNAVEKAVFNVTAYNPTTKTGAILQGDFAVNTISNQLRAMVNTPVVGAGSLTTLMGIGVGFQKDGTLAVDSTQLNAAMTSNFSDIAAVFGTVGQSSDPQISFGSAPSTVQPGNYAVNISQLATHGQIAGSAAAGTTTITAGVNDTLNLSLDGVGTTVTLAPGAYTAASLAAEVQTQINGASALSAAGASVAVTQSGGVFTITSNSYGSTSNVSIAGNGASNLLGGAPVSTAGLDVAGTIGGEAATGSGQFLTAAGGGAMGLKIQISGGALGARSTFNYSQGIAGILNQWATTQVGSSGLVSSATTGVNSSLKSLANQITEENLRLTAIQAQYTSQYTALDGVLSSLNSTQQYLTAQLANLPNSPKSA